VTYHYLRTGPREALPLDFSPLISSEVWQDYRGAPCRSITVDILRTWVSRLRSACMGFSIA
jgi:hypothetical protein